jgi:predicted AlkP superfamily phosphohydrolase/phosphomutase
VLDLSRQGTHACSLLTVQSQAHRRTSIRLKSIVGRPRDGGGTTPTPQLLQRRETGEVGTIKSGDVEKEEKKKFIQKVIRIKDDTGVLTNNGVLEPTKDNAEARGDKPGLKAYFRDLDWRLEATVGHDSPHLSENDTGADDSVHSTAGVLLMSGPGADFGENRVLDAPGRDTGTPIVTVMGLNPKEERIACVPKKGGA